MTKNWTFTKTIIMKNTIHYKREIIEFHAWVAKALPRLQFLKQGDNQIEFYSLMEKMMPEVKQYINRQYQVALKNKTLPKGKYNLEDFTDELYIEAYDNIQNLTKGQNLHQWLFSMADKIMEDIIIEEDFDNMFFKNIDNYTKEEWEAMDEKFTRDGDGDLVMLEELDDISYSKQDYTLADVFIENEEEDSIDKLSAKLTQKEIQQQIESALFLLPFHLRTIFELSVNQQFDAEEIADIKKMTITEVEVVLEKAKKIIRTSFMKKHLNE